MRSGSKESLAEDVIFVLSTDRYGVLHTEIWSKGILGRGRAYAKALG